MRSEIMRAMHTPETVLVAVPSPFVFLFKPAYALAALMLVIVVGGGSAAAAAEEALPGDTLYGIKLAVNERLERAVAVTPEARATVEVRQAQERLQEVELLAAVGDVEETTLDEAAAKVEEHIARVDEVAQELLEEGDETAADAVHAKLTAALATHADILHAQSEDADEDEQRSLRLLALTVRNAAGQALEAQDEAIPRADQDEERSERLATARKESVERSMEKLAEGLRDDGIAPESQEELSAEYLELEGEMAEALAFYESGEFRQAANAYEKIDARASRTLILFASAKRIEEHTDKEVLITLEKIVPVAATEEAAPMLMMEAATFDTRMMKAPEEDEPEMRRQEFRFRVRDRDQD